MTNWLRPSLRAWVYINGPGGALLVLAQTVGLPLYAIWVLEVLLVPGTAISDVVSRVFGLSGMPDWYYAVGWPAMVVTINLLVYLMGGMVLGWAWSKLDESLSRYADRRKSVVETYGLLERVTPSVLTEPVSGPLGASGAAEHLSGPR